MNQSITLEVPASGGKVNIVFPNGSPATLSFDIPAPGGTITINLAPNDVRASGSKPAPMLFSSLPLPFEKPPVLKYTPIPRPPVAPRISTYVPCRPLPPSRMSTLRIHQPFLTTCPTAAL
ncbi:hypothetical protein BDZ89DRAFT_1162925 [Hymenopellis radicata]|nr:hypothetical protein BDZ89DRAFT_1162925 [Hymenopellis radicata]